LGKPSIVQTAAALPCGSIATAGSDDEIAIVGYDTLTVEQVLPRLRALSQEQLAGIDGYERVGRSRKRILERIAALRSTSADGRLAKL